MTRKELNAAKARAKAATNEKWTWEDDPPTLYSGRTEGRHGLNLLGRLYLDWNGKANMDFITTVHTDAPAAYAQVEKMDAAFRPLVDSWQECNPTCQCRLCVQYRAARAALLQEEEKAEHPTPECVCVHSGTCGDAQRGLAGYFCTRARGHSGPHIACGGGEHRLDTWPQSPPPIPGPPQPGDTVLLKNGNAFTVWFYSPGLIIGLHQGCTNTWWCLESEIDHIERRRGLRVGEAVNHKGTHALVTFISGQGTITLRNFGFDFENGRIVAQVGRDDCTTLEP